MVAKSLAILLDSGEFAGPGMWPMVLVVGGIPFAIGLGSAYGGYALIRNARNNRLPDDGDTVE